MTAVEQALAEIQAALDMLAPQHEGLRDLTRLNLLPETMREVRLSLAAYDQRVQKLQAAQGPLQALLADGYPDLGARHVSDATLQDLQENLRTITAAEAQFVSNAATTLNLTAGAPEAK